MSSEEPDLEAIAAQVLDLAAGVDAEVRVSRRIHGLTRFANSFIHQHVSEDTTTVDLRIAAEGRVASSSITGALRSDDLTAFVERTIATAGLVPVDPDWPGLGGPVDEPTASPSPEPEIDPDARAQVVAEFVDAGADGTNAAGYVDTDHVRGVYLNSHGRRASGAYRRATADGIHRTDTSAGYAHATTRSVADLDGAELGARAADTAARGRDPGAIEPGAYEVVLAPECVAEMVSFLIYDGFNAKAYLEGQSFVRLGEQQFDPLIDLVDDATDARAVGLQFDADGTPKRRLHLVRDGVTEALTHDRRTANRAGAASTGHALPGGAMWGALATDVFVRPGDRSVQDLIADVDDGLYVTTFNYVRELDPKTQVITGLTRNGVLRIRGGELGAAVRDLRFTQSSVVALAPGNVLGVADDARFAASEFGEAIVHTPSVRLARFTFTGGEAG
ncbi:MAG: TldD/PmbA family protein [Actinobacteria bacterium]|nr:TldD/PmbA family protein [Actinomycetota bacterium]